MILPILAVLGGLVILLWSADRFVEGSVAIADHFGMPPFLIGIIIVGFGTSSPEIVVSAISASQGNPGIALGNAYGSNIANISLVLGITALVTPISVQSYILRKQLPILTIITAISAILLWDSYLSNTDALILIGIFIFIMFWNIKNGLNVESDIFQNKMKNKVGSQTLTRLTSIFWIVIGLIFLIVSSQILIWGATNIARQLGLSDLIIGLTVVAIGTSLPELASSVMAIRKNQHNIVLGNVLGSNLFNTLAVVGITGTIHPTRVSPEILSRDIFTIAILTISLFFIGFRFRSPGRINRFKGALLLFFYIGYNIVLIVSV